MRARRGFTIVELLVVIVVIAILVSAVLVASSTVVNKARTTSTQGELVVVQNAVDEFKREQTANPTLTRNQAYVKRYGQYPPDELEVFAATGFPTGPKQSLAVGGAAICPLPDNGFGPMRFYTRGLTSEEEVAAEHRDLAAMILAIELFGDTSSAMLDSIQNRYWSPGPVDQKGVPLLFLDRPDATGKLDKKWDQSDLPIRYLVDDWGVPLGYMMQRDWVLTAPEPTASTNYGSWNEAATKLTRLNSGRPLIFSYGPNGPEQLTKGQMELTQEKTAAATLIVDILDDGKINNPLNLDNVYPDDALKDKLAGGGTP